MQTINKIEGSLLLGRNFCDHRSTTNWKTSSNAIKIIERSSPLMKCSRGKVIF